jgi:hypothetical protein
MLSPARLHRAERAVDHAPVRIDRHADAEIIRAVVGVAVEPRPVIDIAVAGRRMSDRLGRLVNRKIVERVEHADFLGV